MAIPTLEMSGLTVALGGREVLREVDLLLAPGEVVGLVGESGSGKTLTGLAALGLLPPAARITGGAISVAGQDMTRADEAALDRLRGRTVALVPQDALSALNPVLGIGRQMTDILVHRAGLSRSAARARAAALLAEMRLPSPECLLAAPPHHLSGGMRQRVLIAMALACDPALLIADEVTTALDPAVQAEVIALLLSAVRARGMAMLFISHDLRQVAACADRAAVMLGGRVMEAGPAARVLAAPRHPYTALLRASDPALARPRTRLAVGPAAGVAPTGCPHRLRCPAADPACLAPPPAVRGALHGVGAVACWRAS